MSSVSKALVFVILSIALALIVYGRSRLPVTQKVEDKTPVVDVLSTAPSTEKKAELPGVIEKNKDQSTSLLRPTGNPAQPQPEAQIRFQKLTEEVKKIIPTQSDLRKLSPQQVHYTPEVIQKAALGVGEIAQMIADNPKLAPEGLKFYRECAEKNDNPISLRANCFVSHEQVLKKYGGQDPSLENDSQVDDNIKKLARPLL